MVPDVVGVWFQAQNGLDSQKNNEKGRFSRKFLGVLALG